MIDVWSVLWGDKYPAAYVYALREAVAENLRTPHRFRCLADRDVPGIDTTLTHWDWPGWWQKLGLFSACERPSLYFDLDVLITGSLDYLVEYTEHAFAAPANWAQSGHGGIQSSVMAWNGTWRDPVKQFDPEVDTKRLWGDQEYLWELLGDRWTRLPGIYSYKYHCRGDTRPVDMAVCVFHGRPKPHEVSGWTSSYTQTLRRLISSSTASGGAPASRVTASG